MAALSFYTVGRGIDNQHFHFCYFKNWHYWPLVLADVLLPRGWSPSPLPTGWRISAPPWATLTVVLITLAWCHSLLEFKSSPRWLEMYVASSTNLVGFEDFHIKIVREFLLRISLRGLCAVVCVLWVDLPPPPGLNSEFTDWTKGCQPRYIYKWLRKYVHQLSWIFSVCQIAK